MYSVEYMTNNTRTTIPSPCTAANYTSSEFETIFTYFIEAIPLCINISVLIISVLHKIYIKLTLYVLYFTGNMFRSPFATIIRPISHSVCHPCAYSMGSHMFNKTVCKRPLGRPRRRWEDNIRMDLQEVVWGCQDWIGLAQDRDRWRALVSTVMILRVP
jgi:hypothetical protein